MKRPMATTMIIIAMTMNTKHCDRVRLIAMLEADVRSYEGYCYNIQCIKKQLGVTVLNRCNKVVLRSRRCVYCPTPGDIV